MKPKSYKDIDIYPGLKVDNSKVLGKKKVPVMNGARMKWLWECKCECSKLMYREKKNIQMPIFKGRGLRCGSCAGIFRVDKEREPEEKEEVWVPERKSYSVDDLKHIHDWGYKPR